MRKTSFACPAVTVWLLVLLFTVSMVGGAIPAREAAASAWRPRPVGERAPVVPHHYRIVDYGADVGEGYYRGGGDWQETLVGEVDVDGDGEMQDDSVAFVPYSETDPINPRWPTYDEQATSAIMYGGITLFFANKRGRITEGMINAEHEHRDDFNLMGGANGPGEAMRAYGFWFWKKEDFLNGGDRFRVTFDDRSMVAVHFSRYCWGFDAARWVVRDGDRFLVSEATFAGPRTSHVLHPTETRWALYQPRPPYHIAFDPARAEFKQHQFQDVTAVGFYIARDTLERGSVGLKWHAFETYALVHRPPSGSFHLQMQPVPAGTVDARDGKSVPVESLYVSATEVPFDLWQRVWKWAVSNQYCFDLNPGYVFDRDGDMGSMKLGAHRHTPAEPATDMTWYDAVAWCNSLSELEGRTPCYYADPEFEEVLRIVKERDEPKDFGWKPPVYVRWDADGFRLPTYAEWAWAAGSKLDFGTERAWTSQNAGSRTHAVGLKQPNELGLYDTAGNVWEFIWDAPHGGYDPESRLTHTVVGGGFRYPEDVAAGGALPYGENPFSGNYNIGLRVVRAPDGLVRPPVLAMQDPPPGLRAAAGVPTWTFARDERVPGAGAPPGFEPEPAMVHLPEGGFTRRADNAKVTISPLFMSRTEVTYERWNLVYQWAVNHGYSFDTDGDMGSSDHRTEDRQHGPREPVTDVIWRDAVLWCNALSEMAGRTPCYYTDEKGTNVYRRAWPWRVRMHQGTIAYHPKELREQPIYCKWSADGYRLPTEAEWEYAYRGGLRSAKVDYHWQQVTPDGKVVGGPEQATEYGWLAPNSGDRTHPVARLKPNPYGLYDMDGNVLERVWDWAFYDYYRADNPRGGTEWALFGRPMRGGSFASGPFPAHRHFLELPSAHRSYHGFRVVRCEAGVQQEDQAFEPPVVLEIDPEEFDPLQGQVFRANLMRTGVFDAHAPRQRPALKWKVETGGPVRSSPVVVNDVCYVGSGDGFVYALDAETGREVWKYRTGGPVHGSAAVAEGTVFIGSDDAHLYALDSASGALKWRFKRHYDAVRCGPAPAYGVVWAGFGTYSGGGLSGLDIATGEEVWRYRFYGMNRGPVGVATDGKTIYAPAADIHVFAADIRTEYPVWRAGGAPCHASMPIWEDLAFHHGRNRLLAFYKDTGEHAWSMRHSDTSGADRNPTASPAVNDGVLYACWKDGHVQALDARTGDQIWDMRADSFCFSSPAVAGGVLLFGNDDGNLYAVDAASGEMLWRFATGGLVRSSPWVAEDAIYVGSDNGCVYALQ